MGMTVKEAAVLVPFRPGDEHRQRALVHVLERWARYGWATSVADDGDRSRPWCKARAVAEAFRGTREPVCLVADADCFVPDEGAVRAAVDAVRGDGHRWAMPHGLVRRLDERATRECERGGPWNGSVARSPYTGFEGGGLVVLDREALLECPPDPRFKGWGSEDLAWGIALRCLYGPPWRGDAQLVHLWHGPPKSPGATKSELPASRELLAAYRQAAKRGPDAMRELLRG